MFDIKAIRDDHEAFDKGLERRGLEPQAEALLALDAELRGVITRLQEAQTERNAASKDIGRAKAGGDEAGAQTLMARVAELKGVMARLEEEERALSARMREALAAIPNLPQADVPDGADESGNVVRHVHGQRPEFDFQPREHDAIGTALGQMDFDVAARLSGARFVVLRGALARLERALARFMLDLHTLEFGYEEVSPPLLVRDATMFGTAQLPKFAEDQFATQRHLIDIDYDKLRLKTTFEYLKESLSKDQKELLTNYLSDLYISLRRIMKEQTSTPKCWRFFNDISGESIGEIPYNKLRAKLHQFVWKDGTLNEQEINIVRQFGKDKRIEATIVHGANGLPEKWRFIDTGLWLVPTAEVPLTNLAREQIWDEGDLPMRFTAHTPCFRQEAGAAGRDTRGMIRLHQFNKVELVSITTPERSGEEHERMLTAAEEVLKRLGLHYRVVTLCTGDMGFAAQKTFDIEVWLPGQGAFREISSCSLCGDFQARRMNARYRPKGEKTPRFVHTLNGSGLAVGRTLVAVLENYQQADGSVRVPEALVPCMNGLEVIRAQ